MAVKKSKKRAWADSKKNLAKFEAAYRKVVSSSKKEEE